MYSLFSCLTFSSLRLLLVLQRFIEDADILQEQRRETRLEAPIDCVRRAVRGMLYAGDECVVSRSPRALANTMEVIVHVCDAFDLTVSEKKTEIMRKLAPHIPPVVIHLEATWKRYRQIQSFTYRVPRRFSTEITWQSSACWMCIRQYQ